MSKRYIKIYQKIWRTGLRKQLLAGNVVMTHMVDGKRVVLDPKYYRALEFYPPPLSAAAIARYNKEPEPDPIIVLGEKPLRDVVFHEVPGKEEAIERLRLGKAKA